MKSSELARKTEFPHTKIKRWAREFLPRDPRAKMRSGYTREYSLNDAFDIVIGGYLVSDLKFEVGEARMILSGLRPFLLFHALYPEMNPQKEAPESDQGVKEWEVQIVRNPDIDGFELFCLGFIGEEMESRGVRKRSYKKEWLRVPDKTDRSGSSKAERANSIVHVLKISRIRKNFLKEQA